MYQWLKSDAELARAFQTIVLRDGPQSAAWPSPPQQQRMPNGTALAM